MVRKKGITRRAALGLVGGGMFLQASQTFGFSNMTATRGTSVDIAEDSNALLGIDGVVDTTVTPTFTNHSAYDMDLTLDSTDSIELDVGNNGNWAAPPASFSLAPGESQEVNIRFVGECTDAGAATVDVEVDLLDGTAITGGISLTRDFEIPQSGQVQFEGNASIAGASGKYEFEIVNTGCEAVEFNGIGINETSTDATAVSGGGSFFNVDTGDELVTAEIPIDSSDPTSDTRRDMSQSVTLALDSAVNFEFDRFQRDQQGGGGPPNVDMRGEDIRITMYFGDGSSSTLLLCLDTCAI